MSTADTTAREHLDWCIKRAMECYDYGNKHGAIASFLSDVRKHEGTAHIFTSQLGMFTTLMLEKYINNRSAFLQFMQEFNV